jgi:prepilin-type N-terminal cleavage/methylation domain-containing protein
MSYSGNADGFTLIELLVSIVVMTIVIGVIGDYILQNLQQTVLASARETVLAETELTLNRAAIDMRTSSYVDATNNNPDSNAPSGGWQSTDQDDPAGSTMILATTAFDTSGNIIFSPDATTPDYTFDLCLPQNNFALPPPVELYEYTVDGFCQTSGSTEKNELIYWLQDGTLYKRVLAAPASDAPNNTATTTCPAGDGTCPPDEALLHNVSLFQVTYLDGNGNVLPDVPSPPYSVDFSSVRGIKVHVIVSQSVYNQPITADYTITMVLRND